MEENPYKAPETPPAQGQQVERTKHGFRIKRVVVALAIVFACLTIFTLVDVIIYQAMR